MTSIDRLVQLLARTECAVAFTGAGISTESGLSDFRSPGGIWARHRPVPYDEFLASREARVRSWAMRVELHRQLDAASPNDGHRVLAEWEQAGRLAAVITQNIDGLHQDAGSRRVIELHGTARVVACVGCGREWSPRAVIARIESGDEAPDCDACGQPLKSKTISFGQMMPVDAMQQAAQLARQADVFLAIGSSLVVEPAASIPLLAKQHGATLIILNATPTPLDSQADLVIHEPIGATLRAASLRVSAGRLSD